MQLNLNQVYQVNAIQLLEALPDNSIDALITDPPYSSGGLLISTRKQPPSNKYLSNNSKHLNFTGDTRDQRTHSKWLINWLEIAHNKLKDSAVICLFTDWRQLPLTSDALQMAGYLWMGIAVWDKTEAVRPQKGRFRNQAEYIVWGCKSHLPTTRNVPILPGLHRVYLNPNEKQHLTAKPLEVMLWLVKICEPKGLIVDPFCGSGTTLVAAKEAGYSYLGSDLMAHNVEITQRRLSEVK